MDVLGSLLAGPRARGAFLMRVLLDPPWGVLARDRAPLTVVCVTRGFTWLVPEGGAPVRLEQGDLAVLSGGASCLVADDPATAPEAFIEPGGCGVGPTGEDLCDALDRGVRTWGSGGAGATELLVGTYQLAGEVTGRLLRALPPVAVVREGEWDCPLMPVLAAEITRDEPGQDVVLDRVLDLLVISALRAWFARPEAEAPAWYRAYGDPVVGGALRLMRDHPAHPWTVASLAARVGASRAALSRRFTALVGEPPMTHLTGLRLDMAAELLRAPDATVESVARRVGYGSAFALSTAFKRERGISPSQFRDGA
ncbi:AraC family transcriptional regulator [Streptomyces millisiae]|uniref:AraC family transcriptional regulator n=1 Tax=Streptomyces millisiae TaxID=3075542 RepID=A0ABU2LQI2_9ACTN|nr:AraC family transcriptional regulator [Streptomyces sp. DSM 44918]MDT0319849.1 AraC family transcriptional regulator [Streptomyces sp. DSM 44918]